VDLIALAHGKDMLTTPYVFNEADATAMAKAAFRTTSGTSPKSWGRLPPQASVSARAAVIRRIGVLLSTGQRPRTVGL